MKILRRMTPGLVFGLMALMMCFSTAHASGPVASGSSVVALTVAGIPLTGVVGAATSLAGVTLDGTNKTSTYTIPVTVVDNSGTNAGWNLTITSTQFTTGGATPSVLPTDASQVTSVGTTCATGITCTTPTNALSYPLTVPAASGTAPTAAKFYNAAVNTGLGSFLITPTVTVTAPANSTAGVYSSTVTVALVSGP